MGLGKFFSDVFSGNGSSALDSITGLFDSMPKEVGVAGLFSAASLASKLFGRSVEEDTLGLARDKFEQDIINQRENLAFNREELASRERMQEASIKAQTQAAAISAGAQREIARSRNLLDVAQTRVQAQDKYADRQVESQKGRPELILAGRSAQANQARATGEGGLRAFEAIMEGVQRGLGGR